MCPWAAYSVSKDNLLFSWNCFRTVVKIKGDNEGRALSTVLGTKYPKHLANCYYQEVHLHPKLVREAGPLTSFLSLGWTGFLLSPSLISECICLELTWSELTWSWVLLALWGFLWQLNPDLITAICSDGLQVLGGGGSLISVQISHSP